MITIGEVIQRFQSLYSKGAQSDDSRLTPRHIYSKMKTVRAKLIIEQSKKKQKINNWNYQTLNCIEMIVVSGHECPCLPPMGCEMLRTKHKIPKPLSNMDSTLITNVSTIDGSITYSEITLRDKKYKKGNRYTANKPDYFIQNEYLYITHVLNSPRVISITGIFENPLDVDKFPTLCKEDCVECEDCTSMLDKEFPLDLDLVEALVQISVEELIGIFSQSIEDQSNNTLDSLKEQSR